MTSPHKPKRKLPKQWRTYSNSRPSRSQKKAPSDGATWTYAALAFAVGILGATAFLMKPVGGSDTALPLATLLNEATDMAPAEPEPTAEAAPSVRRTFTFCHRGGGTNCVVDGDTIWLDGSKIRLADIDAPETHPPRCPVETDLGARATRRLHDLLNAGSFEVRHIGDRDQDQYGRELRVLTRGGLSLGDILVSEGLARTWTGRREPWC